MIRHRSLVAALTLAAAPLTGCDSEKSYHVWQLQDGVATYQATTDGLEVSGSFTLAIELDRDEFDSGDESDVYLNRLTFTKDYSAHELYPGISEAFEVEITAADVSLPYQATVGTEHRARFGWRATLPAMDPVDLCYRGLRAEIYLSLGDELDFGWLEAARGYSYSYGYQPIAWTPDPCGY